MFVGVHFIERVKSELIEYQNSEDIDGEKCKKRNDNAIVWTDQKRLLSRRTLTTDMTSFGHGIYV